MTGQRSSEFTPRLRAAWAFSGLGQDELAEAAGVNSRTLRGYLRKANPNVPQQDVRAALARAAGVPPSFMEEGFARLEEGDGALQELRQRMDAVVVLLPILLELSGGRDRLPAVGARALERALGTTALEDRQRPA